MLQDDDNKEGAGEKEETGEGMRRDRGRKRFREKTCSQSPRMEANGSVGQGFKLQC